MLTWKQANLDFSKYTLRQKFSIIAFRKGGRNAWYKRIPVIHNLTLSFLFDVMLIKETDRIFSGLKSVVIKILNDKS